MKPSIHIITGKYKHFRLPPSPQGDVRPASNLLRGCAFDVLVHRLWPEVMDQGVCGHLQGKRVLDLCAGTGAYGFEALSRGAAEVTFVDASRQALQHIQAIGQQLPLLAGEAPASTRITVHHNVLPLLTLGGAQPFHAIFLDPPYHYSPTFIPDVLESLLKNSLMTPETVVVIEYATRQRPHHHEGFRVLVERALRRSSLRFLSPAL